MAKTSTFATSTAAVAVTTTVPTKSVTIQENAQPSTTTYSILAPTSGSAAALQASGSAFTFTCPGPYWPALTVVGYMKVTAGTPTFWQYEAGL